MRTVYCGYINVSYVGKKVILCGWVHKFRDLGKLIFVDLRDREGIIQICFNAKYDSNVFNIASKLRNEYCIQLFGVVKYRPKKEVNLDMVTGLVEVIATDVKIINPAVFLPLNLNSISNDELRLQFRYFDLRRLEMINNLRIRSNVINFVHRFMDRNGFLNIETPILGKKSFSGSNNYLVPSRINKDKVYALSQSPQLYKQLLMISGFDRYYQIAKCFRDEDCRSDRQPEFTQIDIEASFIEFSKFKKIVENLIRYLWKKVLGVKLNNFLQMTYNQVLDNYGTDKPDLRNPIKITNVTDLLGDLEESVLFFSSCKKINNKSKKFNASVIKIKGGSILDISSINKYYNNVKSLGAEHLIWIKIIDDDCNKFIFDNKFKFLDCDLIGLIARRVNGGLGDILFLIIDNKDIVVRSLRFLREKLGKDFNLISKNSWCPVWIVDFPMFKIDDNGNLYSTHHPFVSPKHKNIIEFIKNPMFSVSTSYDVVINGYEICSGSERINNFDMQQAVFDVLGISRKDQIKNFGFFINSLKSGAPPHMGCAFGLDRIVMLLTYTNNIRDVIAFPKSNTASDLMF